MNSKSKSHTLGDVFSVYKGMQQMIEFYEVPFPPLLQELFEAVGAAVMSEQDIRDKEEALFSLSPGTELREASEAAYQEALTFFRDYQSNLLSKSK